MSRSLVVALLCFSVVAPLPARAADVLLVKVDAADPSAAEQVDSALRNEARRVVGERLIGAAPEKPAGCRGDDACAAALAGAHGASLVVIAAVAPLRGAQRLRATLHDGAGKLIAAAEREITRGLDKALARGVVLELLSPADYVGRLRFEDLPPGAQVTVDRLPLSQADLADPYPVSVGRHAIEVTLEDHRPFARDVEVGFEQQVPVKVALASVASGEPPTPTQQEPPPVERGPEEVAVWPAGIAGGLALIAAVTAVGFAADLVYTQARVASAESAFDSPTGFEPHHYAATVFPDAVVALRPWRQAVAIDTVLVGSASAVAVVGAATAAALIARWALADDGSEGP